MEKITYKIIPNAGLGAAQDDYQGIVIFLNGEYITTFTGFLREDLLRRLLLGGAEEEKNENL